MVFAVINTIHKKGVLAVVVGHQKDVAGGGQQHARGVEWCPGTPDADDHFLNCQQRQQLHIKRRF
jgi:hypothetical protein